MKIGTLGIVLKDNKILLGEKKRGEIGTGVLSGPGGKLDPGETLKECLVRETREELEIELDPASLELTALIDFYVMGEIDFRVYIYRAKILSGEIHETVDMIPAWYSLDKVPFERTYEADRYWLPRIVKGEKFNANVYYRDRARNFDHIDFFPFAIPVCNSRMNSRALRTAVLIFEKRGIVKLGINFVSPIIGGGHEESLFFGGAHVRLTCFGTSGRTRVPQHSVEFSATLG